MANADKGEVAVTIGGTSYTLKQSINAAIEVETLFSKLEGRKVRWAEVIEEVNQGSAAAKRAVFWAMLRTHHPDVTLDRAGELSDQLDAEQALATREAVGDAVRAGAPDPQDLAVVTKAAPTGRPQKAQAGRARSVDGTGVPSTSVRAMPA
jgi:hypothetical protein